MQIFNDAVSSSCDEIVISVIAMFMVCDLAFQRTSVHFENHLTFLTQLD